MTVAHTTLIILIPILGIFLFFQQLLMEKQEEAFPLLPKHPIGGADECNQVR